MSVPLGGVPLPGRQLCLRRRLLAMPTALTNQQIHSRGGDVTPSPSRGFALNLPFVQALRA